MCVGGILLCNPVLSVLEPLGWEEPYYLPLDGLIILGTPKWGEG